MSAPVLSITLLLQSGERLTRELSVAECERLPAIPDTSPQPWMLNASRSWPAPQDPVSLVATVIPGHEREAQEWLATFDPPEEA